MYLIHVVNLLNHHVVRWKKQLRGKLKNNNNNDCGSGRSTIRPKLYLGPGPMPRRYFAEDE